MDIEKLIAKLRSVSKHSESVLGQAVNALAELQTENRKIRAENIRWKQVVSKQKKQLDKLQAAMDKLPTIALSNEPLTQDELREMDGQPVWVEELKHWALIDIEKGGQWDGIPFTVWAENGAKFTYNVKNRGLHCYRRPPEDD